MALGKYLGIEFICTEPRLPFAAEQQERTGLCLSSVPPRDALSPPLAENKPQRGND